MKFSAAFTLAAVISGTSATLSNHAFARETVLVIGDSLSREYQFEFSTFPEARNWVEILATHRPDDFYFGRQESSDLGLLASLCNLLDLDNAVCRAIGDDGELDRYRYNWAIPTYSAEAYADDLSGGNPYQRLLQDLVDDDFDEVDAVVVFIGGNDLDRVYGQIYNGNLEAGRRFVERMAEDLESIIEFVLEDTPAMRMVLVNVPHIGATPEVKGAHPTDPVRTSRVTDTLFDLDRRLREIAETKGIAYADILPLTIDLLGDAPYPIGGIPMINEGSETGDSQALWLGGDLSMDFHPNTNGQALIANSIISAFNEFYQTGAEPISEFEIIESILGLTPPFTDWAESFGLPERDAGMNDDPDNDGLNNLIECALGYHPGQPSKQPTPSVSAGRLNFEYQVGEFGQAFLTTIPEWSTDTHSWEPVPTEFVTTSAGGLVRVSLPQSKHRQFLRVRATLK